MRKDLISIKSCSTLLVALMFAAPWAGPAAGQTPDADVPPPPVETEVPAPPVVVETEVPALPETPPPPPATEPPAVTEPPVEPTTAPIVEEPTAVPETPMPTNIPDPVEIPVETAQPTEIPTESSGITETPTPTTETVIPTATEMVTPETVATPTEEPSPTPTETPVVADEIVPLVGTQFAIAPGTSQDVSIRFTLGSDRTSTSVSASISASNGASLDGWSITQIDKVDLDENPQDANRSLITRVELTSATRHSESIDITWRVTAPDHIEKPVTVLLDLHAQAQGEPPLSEPLTAPSFASFVASVSVHSPALDCAVAGVNNTWNCTLDTNHPGSDVVASMKSTVPEGWELKHGETLLGASAVPIDAATLQSGVISLAANYPIGCPDPAATFTAQLAVELTYPSGELTTLNADLALTFERPTPTFEITSFEFEDLNLLETLSTTGTLTVHTSEAPCAWQGTIQMTGLETDEFTVPGDVFSIISVEGLPDGTVTMNGSSISISAPEAVTEESDLEIVIHFEVQLPHQVPPGAYRVGISTQFAWDDQQ